MTDETEKTAQAAVPDGGAEAAETRAEAQVQTQTAGAENGRSKNDRATDESRHAGSSEGPHERQERRGTESPGTADGSAEGRQAAAQEADYSALRYAKGLWSAEQQADFTENARALGLTAEQAQALIRMNEESIAKADRQLTERIAAWEKSLQDDDDFGGEAFGATVQYAAKALRRYDPSGELVSLLEESGYGSFPAVVKALARCGRDLEDDRIVGRGMTANNAALEERYFANRT